LPAKLIFILYWLLEALSFPFVLLYLLARILCRPAYFRHLGERFGRLPGSIHPTTPGSIWLHAVSVGEILAAVTLIDRIQKELPGVAVYVSTTTLAGRALAEQKLGRLAAAIFYMPLDYRFAMRSVLRCLKPALVVVLETEIWPHLYLETRRSGARLVVVNGRISDRALPRYRLFRWFFRAVLPYADMVLAQDETAAARFSQLGAPRVIASGNLKYDFDPDAVQVAAPIAGLLNRMHPTGVWIAASTMPPAKSGDPDEDDVVLDAFTAIARPGLLLILVPRRPEHFDAAARKARDRGLRVLRRSELNAQSDLPLPGVLVLDTIGELSGLFRVANVVFMGGTFPHRGGHNILEPAAFGVPVLTGPHMENFAEIAAEFRAGDGVITVDLPALLGPTVARYLDDEKARRELGERARILAERRRGATARALQHISELYDTALPRPWGWNPLGPIWHAGLRLDRALRTRRDTPQRIPVVSIGNLSTGGSGKTPFVIWLTARLLTAGKHVAVLTRGYGRVSSEIVTALPYEHVSVESVGEEARLILRAGAAIAVGANRRAARAALERRFRPDVYLLDDGFQHWPLQRDLDIVLIDALDPFRGGLLPRGRLREPFKALARASAVVITRSTPGRAYRGLSAEIRRYNPTAPILLAHAVAHLPKLDPRRPVGAFCALGQPESFRRTLAQLGIQPAFFETFPDHHRYAEHDLCDFDAQLLTTEKDLFNIDPALAARLGIQAVPMSLEVDAPAPLFRLIEECLRAPAAGA
jgi:tetraacyldisaccharide 4'-kinase